MINSQSKRDIDHIIPNTNSLRPFCIEFSANEKLFQCTSCPKKFKKPSSLKAHVFSHSKEKPHRCLSPGCDKAFSLPSNLRRHKKLVHMKASSSTHVHRTSPSSRNLQPLGQCQSINTETIPCYPSSLPLFTPSISPLPSPPFPLTAKRDPPSQVAVCNANLTSSAHIRNTAYLVNALIDPSFLHSNDLTDFCIDPSHLAVPNSSQPMQAADDNNTTISHSFFNTNNSFPTDFNQSITSNQHLRDQSFKFTTALSQLDIFPF